MRDWTEHELGEDWTERISLWLEIDDFDQAAYQPSRISSKTSPMKEVRVYVQFHSGVEHTPWFTQKFTIQDEMDYFSDRTVYSFNDKVHVRLRHMIIPSATPVSCIMKKTDSSSQMEIPALDIEVDTSTTMHYMMPWISTDRITLTSRLTNYDLQVAELLQQPVVTVQYVKDDNTLYLRVPDDNTKKVVHVNRFGTLEIQAMENTNIIRAGGVNRFEIRILVEFDYTLMMLVVIVFNQYPLKTIKQVLQNKFRTVIPFDVGVLMKCMDTDKLFADAYQVAEDLQRRVPAHRVDVFVF
eukprot:GHVS01093768.1.p1 GENE.GHVS01093768.1~~GHVS01093768.1.p1  ORF type:complete len:297 (+),score=27.20 GHVS01093768.1:62-952(+)